MDCNQLLQTVTTQFLQRTKVRLAGSTCVVEMPLLEASGDVINIYVEEQGDHLKIHDGGHIAGLLFEAGPAGASATDRRAVHTLVRDSGLSRDAETGVVFAIAERSALVYWMFEIGRTMVTASAMTPTTTPRRRAGRRLGPKVAQQIIQRLIAEGLMWAITPGTSVQGITEQPRHVDLSYTIPKNPMKTQPDTSVFIITLDLDVANPMDKANRGLAVATDLGGTAGDDNDVDVRIVHSSGGANASADRAKRLIKAAAGKHLLKDYSWDEPEEREGFLSIVAQEVALR